MLQPALIPYTTKSNQEHAFSKRSTSGSLITATRTKQRDEKLAEKLTRILFVRVNLWSKGGTVTCRDRILSSDAPSKPL